MKRIVAMLLAILMCVSLFAACGQGTADPTNAPDGNNETPTNGDTQGEESKEFSYPTSGSLTYWMWLNGNVSANYPSLEATPIAGWIKEATGVDVDYVDDHSNTDEAFQLMISDSKMPDMIAHNFTGYSGGYVGACNDGICIKLNDVIDQYMPNLKAYLAANPDVDTAIKDYNGDYYYIPGIGSKASVFTKGNFINADMLKKLNAEVPTTIDGWHDLFVRVRDELNVVPLTCMWGDLMTNSILAYAYGVGIDGYGIDDNGEVVYRYNSENYKAFLETVAAWYAEGLIDTDIATIANDDCKAKMINQQAFMSTGYLGSYLQQIEQASDEFTVMGIPQPSLKEGVPATDCFAEMVVGGGGTVITPSCENVELAARWCDFFFSEEGHLLANFGKEGETWNMVDGVPTFADTVFNNPEGYTASQSIARYNLISTGNVPSYRDDAYYAQTLNEKSAIEAMQTWANSVADPYAHRFPNVSYTAEETEVYAGYKTNLTTTAQEWFLAFVIGTATMDQWDEYVAELDAMGAQEALAINQAAYARYIAR